MQPSTWLNKAENHHRIDGLQKNVLLVSMSHPAGWRTLSAAPWEIDCKPRIFSQNAHNSDISEAKNKVNLQRWVLDIEILM